jgi:hypothetical protein
MPTAPSVMIQVLAALACLLLAMSEAASSGAGVFARGLEAAFPGPPKFSERLALNFFSILLAGGRKIARKARKRATLDAAF